MNKRLLFAIGFYGLLLGIVLALNYGQPDSQDLLSPIPVESGVIKEDVPMIEETEPSPTPTPEPVKDSFLPRAFEGKVSHYSVAGCIGCSPTLTMSNGETLSDDQPTIAFNHLPLNTKVKITNLDNGKSIIATVTDRGGFEKYGRIADLTPVVYGELQTKTDVSTVRIEVID